MVSVPAQDRQQIYNFTHRLLKHDAHTRASMWSVITGDRAYGYLTMRWDEAADGRASLPRDGMLFVDPIARGDLDICLLRMPDPQASTEPYYAAFVRSRSRPFPLRYFVLERSFDGGAYWSEWRPDMRIRGADVPEWPSDMQQRIALPYPYAAAFVEAIVAEAGARPTPKREAAADPRPPARPVGPDPNRIAIYIIIAAVLVIALVALTR